MSIYLSRGKLGYYIKRFLPSAWKPGPVMPEYMDIECEAGEAIARYSGTTDLGCCVVSWDLPGTTRGGRPVVKKADSNGTITDGVQNPIGVVAPSEGDIASGGRVMVRVWGIHEKVRTGGSVGSDYRVMPDTTAGQVINESSAKPGNIVGHALADDSGTIGSVFITNPFGFPFS